MEARYSGVVENAAEIDRRIEENARGWTQEQVAARLQLSGVNMSRDFYAHIENGSYNIRVSELAALRKIFGCRYDDFFAGI